MSLPLPDGEDTCIEWIQENPKKIGSLSYDRYERYKGSKTVKEAKQNGAIRADFENDYKKGFLKITTRSNASAVAQGTENKREEPKKGDAKKDNAAQEAAAAKEGHGRNDTSEKPEAGKADERKRKGEAGKADEQKKKAKDGHGQTAAGEKTEAGKADEQKKKAEAGKADDQKKKTKDAQGPTEPAADGKQRPRKPTLGAAAARVKAGLGKMAAGKFPRKNSKKSAQGAATAKVSNGDLPRVKKKKKKDKKGKKSKKEKKEKKDKKEKREPGRGSTLMKAKLANIARGATDSKGLLIRTHGKHSSKYMGVHLDKASGKWQATLMQPSGARRSLGLFAKEEEAAKMFTNVVRKQEVLLAKPKPTEPSPSQALVIAPAAHSSSGSSSSSSSSGSGEWSLAKSISELSRQLDELSEEQMGRVKEFLKTDSEVVGVNDLSSLPLPKLRELTRFIRDEYAASAATTANRLLAAKASTPVVPQRLPTGAPLPPAVPSRAAAPSAPSGAKPSASARPSVAAAAPSAAAHRPPAPGEVTVVPGKPSQATHRPPLAAPAPASASAGGSAPKAQAASTGHASAPSNPGGAAAPLVAAVPGVLGPRAPKTPPLKRPSLDPTEAPANALKPPRTEALMPRLGQLASHNGGCALSGCGGSASSTAAPQQYQLALQPHVKLWETQAAWDTSAGSFGVAWDVHNGATAASTLAASLRNQTATAPAGVQSEALVPFDHWKPSPLGAGGMLSLPLAGVPALAVPALAGLAHRPFQEPLIWLGDNGGWAPGRGPGLGLLVPSIAQGTTNPPGPCREGCRCNQVASHPKDLEKPWLEDKVRSAAVQAAIQCFERQPGVLRRGRVSHQNRFQPAPVGVYDQRYEPPPATVPEPLADAAEAAAPPERSPPTGPVPQ